MWVIVDDSACMDILMIMDCDWSLMSGYHSMHNRNGESYFTLVLKFVI